MITFKNQLPNNNMHFGFNQSVLNNNNTVYLKTETSNQVGINKDSFFKKNKKNLICAGGIAGTITLLATSISLVMKNKKMNKLSKELNILIGEKMGLQELISIKDNYIETLKRTISLNEEAIASKDEIIKILKQKPGLNK